MYILGLNAFHPDSSASLIKNGRLIAAVEEERFLRIKSWAGLPVESIRYCLREAGIGIDEVDYIALNSDPKANLYKKIFFVISKRPPYALIKDRLSRSIKMVDLKDALSRELLGHSHKIKAKLCRIEHHLSHLASSFFVSPFNEAVLVSLDGFGDFVSCMVARGKDNKIGVLYRVNFPHSLGIFYTAFTQFLGFKSFGDEYKVMGLAAYGRPSLVKEMEKILIIKSKGRFALNLDYFTFHKTGQNMQWFNAEPALKGIFSSRLAEKFGSPRVPSAEMTQFHRDIAASAQATYEKAFFHVLRYAHSICGKQNLCLSGGCALNSLANGKILKNTAFKEIFIPPASSDAGGSLGACYYLYNQILGNKRAFIMDRAYWGPGYKEGEIDSAVRGASSRLESAGCGVEKITDEEELCRRTAGLIAQGKIIGWFQGRMEWGKRALGNRSILADPRQEKMKDTLNDRIKRRESFRPFAPAVLLERADEYFEAASCDPFMTSVCAVKKDKRQTIPAVTHVDGTARVQTVARSNNPLFWKLIREFEAITGVPVLLNTSLNENEPIVCVPQEALECFLRTRMDALVIGNIIINKR
jgi:carbamoyltransferase